MIELPFKMLPTQGIEELDYSLEGVRKLHEWVQWYKDLPTDHPLRDYYKAVFEAAQRALTAAGQ